MKEPFEQYLNENKWLVWEKSWNKDKQPVQETLFTIGNGYVCMRGIFEEIPVGAQPGTFISGVFDGTGAQVTELINIPNPIDFRIIAEGEKLDITAMDIVSHQRVLDLSKGLLTRKTIYANSKKHRFNYQSVRFFSMHQKHIGVMRIFFTPMDSPVRISVESAVDDSVTNKGIITEGRKKHFHIHEFKKYGSINYLAVKTFDTNTLISYASHLKLYRNYKNKAIPHRTFKLHVNTGETIIFTKVFSVHTSQHIGSKIIRSRTVKTLRKAAAKGFETLLKESTRLWQKKWASADITIRGDTEVDQALRFNIYHMLISGTDDNGFSSISAKTLSGEGYRGHVFWDTEIFMLPFYTFTQPHIARSLLLYRFNRLEKARKIAKEKGYAGALFPWESADTGEECTPSWHKDFDGKIIEIFTMLREHHISADISYAVYQYYLVTGDDDFILKYGIEIMLETARFWVSRLSWNTWKKAYEIKNVIGPDEFHEDVHNNAYTNTMAQWNMVTTLSLIRNLRKRYPQQIRKLLTRMKCNVKEMKHMTECASKIANTMPGKKKIIEEFTGYFKKQFVKLKYRENRVIPEMPAKIPLNQYNKTQLIKQADVLMLLYLLRDWFSPEIKKKNYFYYVQRTLHKSSLSPSMHALIAHEVGDIARAYQFFLASVYIDINNICNNSADGIHAASLGGTWQAIVHGFSGIGIHRGGILSFNPKLPAHWNSIKCKIKWRGLDLHLTVFSNEIEIYFKSQKIKNIKAIIFEQLKTIHANRTNCFKRKGENT